MTSLNQNHLKFYYSRGNVKCAPKFRVDTQKEKNLHEIHKLFSPEKFHHVSKHANVVGMRWHLENVFFFFFWQQSRETRITTIRQRGQNHPQEDNLWHLSGRVVVAVLSQGISFRISMGTGVLKLWKISISVLVRKGECKRIWFLVSPGRKKIEKNHSEFHFSILPVLQARREVNFFLEVRYTVHLYGLFLVDFLYCAICGLLARSLPSTRRDSLEIPQNTRPHTGRWSNDSEIELTSFWYTLHL